MTPERRMPAASYASGRKACAGRVSPPGRAGPGALKMNPPAPRRRAGVGARAGDSGGSPWRLEDDPASLAAAAEDGCEAGVQREQPVALELAVVDVPAAAGAAALPPQLAAEVERARAPVDPLPVEAEELVATQAMRHCRK